MRLKEDTLIHSDIIEHFGIKGMRWGKKKSLLDRASDFVGDAKKKASGFLDSVKDKAEDMLEDYELEQRAEKWYDSKEKAKKLRSGEQNKLTKQAAKQADKEARAEMREHEKADFDNSYIGKLLEKTGLKKKRSMGSRWLKAFMKNF